MKTILTTPDSATNELLPLLGPFFRESYSVSPWDECLRCPVCSPERDYGPRGRYAGSQLSACPDCGAKLLAYWSDARTAAYFHDAMAREGAWLILGIDDASEVPQIAAWSWGYQVSPQLAQLLAIEPESLYVDIVGVIPEYRGAWTITFFREGQNLLLQRVPCLTTRTHNEARHVQFVQVRTGWKRCHVVSKDDPDRGYWVVRA